MRDDRERLVDILWQVIKKDLPELAETINQLLQ